LDGAVITVAWALILIKEGGYRLQLLLQIFPFRIEFFNFGAGDFRDLISQELEALLRKFSLSIERTALSMNLFVRIEWSIVAVHTRKHGLQAVIVFLCNWIKLVVMTTGAMDRQALKS